MSSPMRPVCILLADDSRDDVDLTQMAMDRIPGPASALSAMAAKRSISCFARATMSNPRRGNRTSSFLTCTCQRWTAWRC